MSQEYRLPSKERLDELKATFDSFMEMKGVELSAEQREKIESEFKEFFEACVVALDIIKGVVREVIEAMNEMPLAEMLGLADDENPFADGDLEDELEEEQEWPKYDDEEGEEDYE